MSSKSNDDTSEENPVQLGFSVSYEDEEHKSLVAHKTPQWKEWDGGQIGGRPSWLQPRELPLSSLECKCCQKPLVFVCQIYAPADEITPNAFHRSLYVFACTYCVKDSSSPGTVRVLRTQLPEENPFYPLNIEEEVNWSQHKPETWNVNLCQVCGQRGTGKCPIQQYYFCGKHHQSEHKRYIHDDPTNTTKFLPSVCTESELVVEEEPQLDNNTTDQQEAMFSDEHNEEDEDLEQEDLNKITGAVTSEASKDQTTIEFYARTKLPNVQEQCLRYLRWPANQNCEMPLWIRSDHQPDSIPCCDSCGAQRKFEFEIMPQMIHYLMEDNAKHVKNEEYMYQVKQAIAQATSIMDQAPAEQVPPEFSDAKERAVAAMRSKLMEDGKDELSWGVIAVYTCTDSCGGGLEVEEGSELGAYREEYAWKQPSLD